MDNIPVSLPPKLLNSFGLRLDSGDLDLRDMENVMFRAECVALDLRDAGLSADEIARPLERALQHWTPELIDQFSEASDGAWDSNDEVEDILKAILRRIILTANGGGTLARTVTEEEYLRMHEAASPGRQHGD